MIMRLVLVSAPMNVGDKKGKQELPKLFDYISKGNERSRDSHDHGVARDGEGDQPVGRMYFVMPGDEIKRCAQTSGWQVRGFPKPSSSICSVRYSGRPDAAKKPNRKRSC